VVLHIPKTLKWYYTYPRHSITFLRMGFVLFGPRNCAVFWTCAQNCCRVVRSRSAALEKARFCEKLKGSSRFFHTRWYRIYVYIFICMYMYICICVYVYMYIWQPRVGSMHNQVSFVQLYKHRALFWIRASSLREFLMAVFSSKRKHRFVLHGRLKYTRVYRYMHICIWINTCKFI